MNGAPSADARAVPRVLLPIASGVLLAAATPPALSPFLPFIALVPLAVFVATLPGAASGALAAAWVGGAVGTIQHGWGLRWLPATLGAVAGPAVGAGGFAAVVLVLGALTGAATALLHRLVVRGPGRGRPVPIAVALPVVWTALEWTLAHLPLGLAFPWAPLGLGLARWPETLGVAELVGVGGVTFWLAAVGGLLAQAIVGGRSRGARRTALAAVGALALALAPIGWGRARAGALDAPVVGRAAALALDLPRRADPSVRAERAAAQLEGALAALEPGTLDLLVLPEMALPLDPASDAGAPLLARVRSSAGRLGAPILIGVLGVEGGLEYNSALLVEPTAGAAPFRSDKRHLVPGVERASAVHAAWLAPRAAGYAAGRAAPVARLARVPVGALVCYDVAFSGEARALVRDGARVLAALAGDGWFGAGAAGSAGVAQQLAHLSLRAIETRTGAVRASAGGPALVLNPVGRAEAATAPGPEGSYRGVVVGPVRALRRPTLYVRTGDLAGPSSAAVLAALIVLD